MLPFLQEIVLKEVAKKGLGILWGYLLPLFSKDGHFRLRRLIAPLLAIGFGFVIYRYANLIPSAAKILNLYDPQNLSFTTWDWVFYKLENDQHYYQIAKDLLVITYLAIGFLYLFFMARNKSNQIQELYGESKDLITFAKAVKLNDGSRCSNDKERAIMNRDIAAKIDSSMAVKVMVINGYHDFTDSESPIKGALDKKGELLKLKVLLLDPFSSYAQERAKSLLQETSENFSWMRYIRDYDKTTIELDHLKNQKNAKIEYKVYCSKPFFRIYLFDRDLYIQPYQDHQHGYAAPMYHYEEGDGSMFQLGKEITSVRLKMTP